MERGNFFREVFRFPFGQYRGLKIRDLRAQNLGQFFCKLALLTFNEYSLIGRLKLAFLGKN